MGTRGVMTGRGWRSSLGIGLVMGLAGCATTPGAVVVAPWRVAEDRREPDVAVFRAALAQADLRPDVVRAMGRLVAPELEPVIAEAFAWPETRAMAAWALGQYGLIEGFDGAHGPSLAPLMTASRDADAAVRAASLLALGRLRAEDEVLRSLAGEADASVRAAAIEGLFWTSQLAQRALADGTIEALVALDASDPAVASALALVFSKRVDARAEALLRTLAEREGETAMFALRGLGKLTQPSAATLDLLARVAASGPRAARIEATLALSAVSLVPDAAEEDVAVRAARAQKTGRIDADETSGWVRAMAIAHRAEIMFDAAWLDDADARVRAAGAAGIAHAGEGWGAAFDKALADADANVRLGALGALGELAGADAEARLVEILRSAPDDATMRGAAVEAAAARKSKALAGELAAIAERSPDARFVEMRETVAATLAELEAWDLLQALTHDAAPSVRAKAERALATHAGQPAPPIDRRVAQASPWLGAPAAARVVLETDRGEVVIALEPELAATTTAAITALVRRGFYDGTTLHRLVQNFVLQGGDPSGTGWGDAGFQLRDEVSERPFERGAIGLAKSGPDTGSCQLFVMLASAPHLAGRYTRLGRVVRGMEVVDRLELGDVIRRARVE